MLLNTNDPIHVQYSVTEETNKCEDHPSIKRDKIVTVKGQLKFLK